MPAVGPSSWPRGRRATSEAEEILATAEAWWDVDRSGFRDGDRYLRNIGTAGSALDLRLGSSGVANSNDPKYLAPEDIGYVYVPGVTSNYLSVPDASALDVLGDIDIRAKVSFDSWAPGSQVAIVAKYAFGGNFDAYALSLTATGGLRLQWQPASLINQSAISSTVTGFAAGVTKWVRATLQVNNGASGNASTFYTSDDGSTWTQLGTVVTGSGVTDIQNGTTALGVGASSGGAVPMTGKVYRAQVLNGIGGTTVLDVDCDAITSGAATSFTATSGQTVTINRATSGRKSVAMPSRSKGGRPLMLLGTDDYMECQDAAQHGLLNFGSNDSFTVLAAYRQWATPPNNRPLVSKANFDTNAGWRLANNGTALQGSLYGNQGFLTVNSPTYTAGTLVAVAGVNNRFSQFATAYANGVAGTAVRQDVGRMDLRVPHAVRVGSNSGGTAFYNDIEIYAAAIWHRALTAREITVINNAAPWGV
jgi:hypothetical protein